MVEKHYAHYLTVEQYYTLDCLVRLEGRGRYEMQSE